MDIYLSLDQASDLFDISAQEIASCIHDDNVEYIVTNNQYRVRFDDMLFAYHRKRENQTEDEDSEQLCN